jgi:hypothetical protein
VPASASIGPAARSSRVAALLAFAAAVAIAPGAAQAWRGPVGFRALTTLDTLPRLRSEARTLQVSSYDRSGGNDDGVSGKYSCPRRVAAGCVIAERSGPGEIESIWFTRDFGNISATGGIQVQVDGRTVLAGQLADVVAGRLGVPFSPPLVADSGQSSGGAYIRVPMPFRRSMRVVTENNPRYYHVIFRAFGRATGVRTFRPSSLGTAAFARLGRSGEADPKPTHGRRSVRSRRFSVPARGSTTIARIRKGGTVTGLALRLPGATPAVAARVLRGARLRVRFDGRRTVDAPLGEFFGSG